MASRSTFNSVNKQTLSPAHDRFCHSYSRRHKSTARRYLWRLAFPQRISSTKATISAAIPLTPDQRNKFRVIINAAKSRYTQRPFDKHSRHSPWQTTRSNQTLQRHLANKLATLAPT